MYGLLAVQLRLLSFLVQNYDTLRKEEQQGILTFRSLKCVRKLIIKLVLPWHKNQLTDQWDRIDSPV